MRYHGSDMLPEGHEMTNPTIMYISDVSHDKAGGAQESIRILVEGLSKQYRVIPVSPESKKINDLHHIVNRYSTFNLRKLGKRGFPSNFMDSLAGY